jgi:hypothetical protein
MPVPIIVGVGDAVNRSLELKDAIEPKDLILQAIHKAIEDTTLPSSQRDALQSSIDDLSVVATWTWPYPDLPGSLSKELGIKPRHSTYSPHGGNQPAKLFDEAAHRITLGQSTAAIVTGGEALASCMSTSTFQ